MLLCFGLKNTGVQAAVMVWHSPVYLQGTDGSTISTNGVLLEAVNVNGTLNPTIVNGVDFALTNGNYSAYTWDVAFTNYYAQVAADGADFIDLMDRGKHGGRNGIETLTLQNLTIGSDYEVQIFTAFSANQAHTVTYTSGGSSTGAIIYNQGYSLIGTFTADAATQVITATPGTNQYSLLQGYQLRSVALAPTISIDQAPSIDIITGENQILTTTSTGSDSYFGGI